MKIMFISDIHGSIKYTRSAITKFNEEEADLLVILGDLLNEYDNYGSYELAEILNDYSSKIIAVKGNCDSHYNQELFNFNITSEYKEIKLYDRKIFATHGHKYNEYRMPNLNKGDIFIQGHLHIPIAEKFRDIFFLSPGSIAEPRRNSRNSYGILENNLYTIKDFENNIVEQLTID